MNQVKTFTLVFWSEKCVAALRDTFFGVFLNETRFFIMEENVLCKSVNLKSSFTDLFGFCYCSQALYAFWYSWIISIPITVRLFILYILSSHTATLRLHYRFSSVRYFYHVKNTVITVATLSYMPDGFTIIWKWTEKYWMNTIRLSHSQPLSYLVRLTTELVCRQP